MENTLRTLIFENASCRAKLVRLGSTWRTIAAQNHYPEPVLKILGELVAASAMLAASLKFEGSLLLQIQGDGPIRLLVAECNNELGMRATVKLAENTEISKEANFQSLLNSNGKGICVLVLDPKHRQAGQLPYQGIVQLSGNSVAQSLEGYMKSSEQLETRLCLNANAEAIAGLMLQQIPQEGGIQSQVPLDHDAWPRLLALASTLKEEEHLALSPHELAKRLFWEEEPTMLAEKPVHFQCTCSREKVAKMLITLGKEELDDALKEQKQMDIHCEFCNAHYVFDKAQCNALFDQAPPTMH